MRVACGSETAVFVKGRELYGLFEARTAIRQRGHALVVEGYMDVVALAQYGVGYAVATLGTATTPWQVQKLLRQSDDVIYCFDGDEAGRRAAWRALENSLAQLQDGKQVRFLFLPDEDDPDSFVRSHGKDEFESLLRQAQRHGVSFAAGSRARVMPLATILASHRIGAPAF